MKKKRVSFNLIGIFLVLCLVLSGCSSFTRMTSTGEIQTETQSVELGSAESVSVQISMGVGKLTVSDGTSKLMDGTFRYNTSKLKPRVSYTVNGSLGELVVDHEDKSFPVIGTLVNEWELMLNNAVPLVMQIDTGAGESVLDFHAVDITELQISTGAGNTNIDLSGNLDHDLSAEISGGVGNTTITLPEAMGVHISASTGIGGLTSSGLTKQGDAYVNTAYGTSPHTLFINISSGVGGIELIAP